jgi:hypothetical protein
LAGSAGANYCATVPTPARGDVSMLIPRLDAASPDGIARQLSYAPEPQWCKETRAPLLRPRSVSRGNEQAVAVNSTLEVGNFIFQLYGFRA